MSIESDLFTALTGVVAGRVYPEAMPQGATLPCIVYRRVSTPRAQAFGSGQTVVRSRPRFQFTCWALTAAAALDLAAQLRTALLAMSKPVTLDNEYTLRDVESGYRRRDIDALIGHAGE